MSTGLSHFLHVTTQLCMLTQPIHTLDIWTQSNTVDCMLAIQLDRGGRGGEARLTCHTLKMGWKPHKSRLLALTSISSCSCMPARPRVRGHHEQLPFPAERCSEGENDGRGSVLTAISGTSCCRHQTGIISSRALLRSVMSIASCSTSSGITSLAWRVQGPPCERHQDCSDHKAASWADRDASFFIDQYSSQNNTQDGNRLMPVATEIPNL